MKLRAELELEWRREAQAAEREYNWVKESFARGVLHGLELGQKLTAVALAAQARIPREDGCPTQKITA